VWLDGALKVPELTEAVGLVKGVFVCVQLLQWIIHGVIILDPGMAKLAIAIIDDPMHQPPVGWLDHPVFFVPCFPPQRHKGGKIAVSTLKRAWLVCQFLHRPNSCSSPSALPFRILS
jgi:hypothetical protein